MDEGIIFNGNETRTPDAGRRASGGLRFAREYKAPEGASASSGGLRFAQAAQAPDAPRALPDNPSGRYNAPHPASGVRRPRLSPRRLLGFLLLALLITLTLVAADIYTFGQRASAAPADAAIVLGAAAYGARPSPVFRERLNHAVTLYRTGQVRALILTGAQGQPGEPPESVVGQLYVVAQGVPLSAIYTETLSHDTRENLYYARELARTHGLDRVLVVSDPLHMRRAMAIALNLGLNAESAPTPTSRYRSVGAQAPFLAREVYYYLEYWAWYTLGGSRS